MASRRRGASFGEERTDLGDGIPVTDRSSCPEDSFDPADGQSRAARAVGVHDVAVVGLSSDGLPSGDCRLQRLPGRGGGCLFEDQDRHVARIFRGLVWERIPRDHIPPLRGCAYKTYGGPLTGLGNLVLDAAFDLLPSSKVGLEHDVTGL